MPSRRTSLAIVLVTVAILGIITGTGSWRYLGVPFGVPATNIDQVNVGSYNAPTSGSSVSFSYLVTSFSSVQQASCLFGAVTLESDMQMDANLQIKVEATAPASPSDITSQVQIFKIGSTNNVTIYRNDTYTVASYSFKVTTSFTGSAVVTETYYRDSNACWGISLDTLRQAAIKDLISQFNTRAYVTAGRMILDLNAPVLAGGRTIVPGYAGVMGIFVQDYRLGGSTGNQGVGRDLSPQGIGTPASLYTDLGLTKQAFYEANPAPTNWLFPQAQVLTPANFSIPRAYFPITINNFGSQLTFQKAGRESAFPQWFCWSYQVGALGCGDSGDPNCSAPCVAQWFRVDILFANRGAPYSIPNYTVDQTQKDKQKIDITSDPTNKGAPGSSNVSFAQQFQDFLGGVWRTVQWIVIAIVIIVVLGVVAIIAIYAGRPRIDIVRPGG